MKYVRIYADSNGESHFEDVDVELAPVDFAPPAPPVNVSSPTPTTHFAFLAAPAGWYGDWHPAPARNIFIVLSGETEVETSDGEVRRFSPGSVVLAEDTTGKGHVTRDVGGRAMLFAFVQLAD